MNNKDRAERAADTLGFYAELQGADEESALVDLLADLRHLVGDNFDPANATAEGHYLAEVGEAK